MFEFLEFALLTISHSSNFGETFKKKIVLLIDLFFNLKKQHKKLVVKELEKVNVPPNSWYVTLHIGNLKKGYKKLK